MKKPDLADAIREIEQDQAKWLTRQMQDTGREPTLAQKIGYLRSNAGRVLRQSGGVYQEQEREAIVNQIVSRIYGLLDLQELLEPPLGDKVANIEIIGHDRVFVTWRDERGKQQWDKTVGESDEEMVKAFENVAAGRVGGVPRAWDDRNFALNFQLPSGHRVHALRRVVARPTITIRSHDMSLSRLEQLTALHMLSDDLCEFLDAAVKAQMNIVVAGATNSGKTTFLRAMINAIPDWERLCTIEDNLELGIDHFEDEHPNTVVMEAMPPNIEGEGAVSIGDLLIESLRMNPDRVIVGEVRGGEVIGMLRAMTQGNDGSMCSIHADDATRSVRRLVAYAEEGGLKDRNARQRVADGVDLVIHIRRDSGLRHVSEVVTVEDVDKDGHPIIGSLYEMKRDDLDDPSTWYPEGRFDRLAPDMQKRCARYLPHGRRWFAKWAVN